MLQTVRSEIRAERHIAHEVCSIQTARDGPCVVNERIQRNLVRVGQSHHHIGARVSDEDTIDISHVRQHRRRGVIARLKRAGNVCVCVCTVSRQTSIVIGSLRFFIACRFLSKIF